MALFREPTAAGESPLVRFLETQGPSTTLAISHIRRATRGAVALSNTQPFAESEIVAVPAGKLLGSVMP